MKRLALAFAIPLAVGTAAPVNADPATQLEINIGAVCVTGYCFPIGTVGVGEPFSVFVRAIDSMGSTDTSYSGTVVFETTDAAGSMPSSYTFTAQDQGIHIFDYTGVFRSLGNQTISVQDVANLSIRGAWTLLVLGPFTPIPTISALGKGLLIALIGAAGVWMLMTRSYGAGSP